MDSPFNKHDVLNDIIKMLATDYPKWTTFVLNKPVDLLLIKSVEIQEKITIKDNPFSEFSKLKPSTYQVVIAIDVMGPDESIDDKLMMNMENLTRYLVVDTVKPVITLLKEYK